MQHCVCKEAQALDAFTAQEGETANFDRDHPPKQVMLQEHFQWIVVLTIATLNLMQFYVVFLRWGKCGKAKCFVCWEVFIKTPECIPVQLGQHVKFFNTTNK